MFDNFKNFATLTVAYNDENIIGGMLKGVDFLYNLVIIGKPWNGNFLKFDSTDKVAQRLGAHVIYHDFKNEKDERNFGLEYLREKGFEHVFIIDSDEYYTKETVFKMIEHVLKNPAAAYRNKNDKVYWKSWKYYCQHSGCLSYMHVDNCFKHKREPFIEKVEQFPDIFEMHHFSYCRSKEKLLQKIETHGYNTGSKDFLRKRLETVWENWQVGCRTFLPSDIKRSIDIPEEILGRYLKSINMLY